MSMSVSPFVRLPSFFPSFFYAEQTSGQHSRGESCLELEALAAVHQSAIAVQSIAISEMLPRTPDLIFVNLTTMEGQPYCLELTAKGWRVTSLRSDCMQGDFTRMELFTRYYRTLFELMEVISPEYRERFAENLCRRFELGNKVGWRRRSTDPMDGSSGPISDCSQSEEAEENGTRGAACSPCEFCRKGREECGGGRGKEEEGTGGRDEEEGGAKERI